MVVNSRENQLKNWLQQSLGAKSLTLTLLTGDAGFRRYFRFVYQGNSYIGVDAPPKWSNNQAFSAIQAGLTVKGLCVPIIHAQNLQEGFYCLSDLGEQLLSDRLTPDNMAHYYRCALKQLPIIATATVENYSLPTFDHAFIHTELHIFIEWLLSKHLGIELSKNDAAELEECFLLLINNALEQPQVLMHRDFHSRNIMLQGEQLAIIDFQDAVIGPITYDAVSLLKDCYIKWPASQIAPLLRFFIEQTHEYISPKDIKLAQWQRWFDLTGLQRHIKAAGIFARLYHRDAKPGYLNDIPLTLSYIVDVCQKYPEFTFLNRLVETRVLPALSDKATTTKGEID